MRKTAQSLEEKAQKHVIMADLMVGYADDLAEMHYEAAERIYIEAGLSPSWFGDVQRARTCARPTIPGYE